MYAQFTEAARSVMQVANQEAIRGGHAYIGTEDILIAIATGREGIAGEVLRSHGFDADTIRNEAAQMIDVAYAAAAHPANKVVEHAMKEAMQLHHVEVDVGHFLLGLLHDETSLACRALVGLGVDLGQVRADVLSRLPPGPAADIARQKSLEELFQDHPRVQELKQRIAQLQLALEEAVKVQDFILAASYRDQRRAVERTLDDLYNELGQG